MAVQPPVPPKPMMPPMAPGAKPPMPGAPGMPPPPGAVPPAGAVPLPPDEGIPQVAFFQQPWVQNVLPFVTSLVAHAVIVVLALTFVSVLVTEVKKPTNEEQAVTPDAANASDVTGGVPNVGTNNDPSRKMMQDKVDEGTPDGNSSKKGPSLDPSDGGGGAGEDAAVALNGVGGGGAGKGIGLGKGKGDGNGEGDGGRLAQFGPPGGGARGPQGPVFGNGGNAKKIVFVCDASGSMINKFSSLKNELNKAISNLKVPQAFDIVFFQDGKASVFSTYKLKQEVLQLANGDNKRNASAFLEEVTTTSTSDPMPGVTVAFQRQPDLIYILTDGDFPDNAAFEKKVKELNKPGPNGKKIKVNTIAFVNDKDTDTAFLTMLERVANENGGVFRHVAENELQ